MTGSPPAAPVARPWTFLVIVLVIAVVVSAAIAYLGIAGVIGGGIPGTHHP